MPATWATHAIGFFGLLLAIYPTRYSLLLLLMSSMAIDGYLQAAVFSNHTILKNFVVLGFFVACTEGLVRHWGWANIVRRFATYSAVALLGMYFFGIFHKINTDFLNPEVSCSVALLQMMPLPEALVANWLVQQIGIYSTFIVEAIILLMLIFPRFRMQGIIFGMAFHMLLALSAYEYYTTFSALTIALHTLFLPSSIQRQLMPGNWPSIIHAPTAMQRGPVLAALLICWTALITLFSWLGDVIGVAVFWFLISAPILIAMIVILRDRHQKSFQKYMPLFFCPRAYCRPFLFFSSR